MLIWSRVKKSERARVGVTVLIWKNLNIQDIQYINERCLRLDPRIYDPFLCAPINDSNEKSFLRDVESTIRSNKIPTTAYIKVRDLIAQSRPIKNQVEVMERFDETIVIDNDDRVINLCTWFENL